MSATSVRKAPSGERLRGKGRRGFQVKLCDPCLSALSVRLYKKGANIYKSCYLLPFRHSGAILRHFYLLLLSSDEHTHSWTM